MNKIALGTARLGLDYGINNERGRIPEREVFQILEYAASRGIDVLDSAPVRVVVGVENLDNLSQNLAAAARAEGFRHLANNLKKLRENEKRIILPFLWRS